MRIEQTDPCGLGFFLALKINIECGISFDHYPVLKHFMKYRGIFIYA